MKKILFPTEFAKHAPEVFKYATELAYFFKAELVVMHAYTKPEFQLANEEVMAQLADVTIDALMAFVQEHLPESYAEQVKVDYVVNSGAADEAILQVALDHNIDLIVMGMTGKTDAITKLLGSTSQAVLSRSDCPVLAVPSKAKFQGIDNIAYATHFEFRDLGAINYLRNWSKRLDAPVHCLHVLESQEDVKQVVKHMNILSKTYSAYKKLHFDMQLGVFEEDFEAFAKSKQADVIAMVTHKRHFLSRLINKKAVKGINQHLSIPLLLIKDNAYEWDNNMEGWVQMVNAIA